MAFGIIIHRTKDEDKKMLYFCYANHYFTSYWIKLNEVRTFSFI